MGNLLSNSEEALEGDTLHGQFQGDYTAQSTPNYVESSGLVPQHIIQGNQIPLQGMHYNLGGAASGQAGVFPQPSWGNEFPLHHAAATGAPTSELNRLVVHEGLDVDEVDHSGSTPLHLAAYYGHDHCVKWLVNKGRARYLKDVDGNTPADVARQNGNVVLAEQIESHMNSASVAGSLRLRAAGGGTVGSQSKEEQLFFELDRAQSKIAALKASEKRARQELENEVAERIKLFRALVNKDVTVPSNSQERSERSNHLNALDVLQDMRTQIVEYKAQRDALAAEMKLIEEAISDFELLLTGSSNQVRPANNGAQGDDDLAYISPSARLRACLRKV